MPAQGRETDRQPMASLLVYVARDADPARLRQLLEPGCQVDAFAEDVVVLVDHVAEADPDPELDTIAGRPRLLVPEHRLLHFHGCLHRFRGARELDQGTVAHQLDDPAAVVRQDGLDDRLAERLEPSERTGLVLLDQPRVADDVGGQDGGEPALDAGSGHGRPP